MDTYEEEVDYSPYPGELLPWMGTTGIPIYPNLAELEEVEPSEAGSDFFSQLSGVIGVFSGSSPGTLSWLGAETRKSEVAVSGGNTSVGQVPLSAPRCIPLPLVPEGTFSPFHSGCFSQSSLTNLSWFFLDPIVTLNSCFNQGEIVGLSEYLSEVAFEGSNSGLANW